MPSEIKEVKEIDEMSRTEESYHLTEEDYEFLCEVFKRNQEKQTKNH